MITLKRTKTICLPQKGGEKIKILHESPTERGGGQINIIHESPTEGGGKKYNKSSHRRGQIKTLHELGGLIYFYL